MRTYEPYIDIRFWGTTAAFMRPEYPSDPVSYEVCTPSAARGMLQSIFWKPGMQWEIRKIAVLSPISFISLTRTDVVRGPSHRARPIDVSKSTEVTLRTYRILRHVAYLVRATMRIKDPQQSRKFWNIARKRVTRGKCFSRPYLGQREHMAYFDRPFPDDCPLDLTQDLGPMLFDFRYDTAAGRADPVFFHARLERGVMYIPPKLYQEVRHDVVDP